jgi:trehalose 6-phosphate phosphatase
MSNRPRSPLTRLPEALTAFLGCEGRAGVLLDFDGTLSPIVMRPELAQIRTGAPEALRRLVGRYALVAVISGRTTEELRAHVTVPGVRLVGSYGLGESALAPEVIHAVREAAASVSGARVESKAASVAVHVRGADDPEAAEASLRSALTAIGQVYDLEVIDGKRVLELVPAGRPLKGGVVESLVAQERLDAVLYAGDDLADLRAFDTLDRLAQEGLCTVKVAVRGAETPKLLRDAANIVVDGPAELVLLLNRLKPNPAQPRPADGGRI